MIYKKISLFNYNNKASKEAYLELYLHDHLMEGVFKRPQMLIVPGGAYMMIAPLEGEPVALRFASEGFNCYVLSYCIEKPYPLPHIDLAVAMMYIKEHYKDYFSDEKISLLGFSAGGHLVGTYAYLYKEIAHDILKVDPKILKPSLICLSYPVVTMHEYTHFLSRDYITGGNKELYDKLSIERNISKDYPPTFIWTTTGDTGVNPKNSLLLIDSLKEHNVISKSFIVNRPLDHGQSNVTYENKKVIAPFTQDELYCKKWVEKLINFIINNLYRK